MLIIGSILESYRSLKDRTLKVIFECNEPTGEQLVQIATMSQKFGYLAFKEEPFKNSEKKMLEDLKSDFEIQGKTKGQRLRAVLYILFEQSPEGYEVFDDFYNAKMEKLIMHFKDKLD